jgi:hypothetical protein
MQALISIFIDDGDRLKCINAGRTRITFLLRSPLYYACVSSWGEPESVTRSHLEYLHLQILSVVSAAQLKRIFERRGNFDLRRLLNGAENVLHTMLSRLETEFAMITSSLHCLRLEPTLRARAGECLLPPNQSKSRLKEILYVILVANGRVITLARPKKHSIHPADLHILLNTIHSPSILNSSASASWLPVCLPKFNPSGFLNVYVNFLGDANTSSTDEPRGEMHLPRTAGAEHTSGADNVTTSSYPSSASSLSSASITPVSEHVPPGIALLCVSSGGDFEAIRDWGDAVARKLSETIIAGVGKALHNGVAEYSVSSLGVPGLRHFIYKSRPHVQVTLPRYEEPYDNEIDQRRLILLYQTIHDNIHAKSGQSGTLKLQFIRTDRESVMGWITQPFELYVVLSPLLPKTAVVGAANAVARWVKKEEARLFLRDAPVF